MFRFRKTFKPRSVTRLNGTRGDVKRVIFLAQHDLVVVASDDSSLRVYTADTSGDPCAVFERHTSGVRDVVHLEEDVVLSVGYDKRLFAWRAATAELVGEWRHWPSIRSIAMGEYQHNALLRRVAKLGHKKVIVGDNNGNVLVLTHDSASSFRIHYRLRNSHSNDVNCIAVHGTSFVTCSNDTTAKVWDSNSLTLLATLPHKRGSSLQP